MPTVGDPYVYNVQQWVNNTYRNRPGYTEIEETGHTGWTTIYALLHGLQITLNVGSTADNFGPGTINAFNNYVTTNGPIQQQTSSITDQTRKEINGIIQGALLCKGYAIGTNAPTEQFLSGTGNAIVNLKEDAGLSDTSTVVTLNIMKALLSMDYFYSYDTSERTQKIIAMQRYLNGNYEAYTGIRPCDGVYGRRTSTGLILAIQAEEQMPTSVANGNCGPATKKSLPPIPYSGGYQKNGQTYGLSYTNNTYTTTQINKFKKLANIALYFNGYGNGNISTTIDTTVVNQFQTNHAISVNGNIDYTTWLSLLISCGDIDRPALGCDCATKLTQAKASTLYNNGYRYIGRYLSKLNKGMTLDELEIAFTAGLNIFPIFQTSGDTVDYFTSSQGKKDAIKALYLATELGIPENNVIYFAVDCDPLDYQITNNILPYFDAVYSNMVVYRVGIYGTRNTCKRVMDNGFAVGSFISDMSTGYSGNLGFPLPANWDFDQFVTVTVGSGSGAIEIDKDGYSGRNSGFNSLTSDAYTRVYNNITNIFDLAMDYTNDDTEESNLLTLQYLRYLSSSYNSTLWSIAAGSIDSSFCSLVDQTYPNMYFTFFDPVSDANGEIVKYDFFHFVATLNALLYDLGDQSGLTVLRDLYAGWAGDALSFTYDIHNADVAGETNLLQWAKDNICQNDETKFPKNDYIADIDALNVAYNISYGLSFPAAFNWYFKTSIGQDEPDVYRRTSYWMGRMPGTYLDSICDLLSSDELRIFAYLLAHTDQVNSEYIDIALAAFKNYVYNEYLHGR